MQRHQVRGPGLFMQAVHILSNHAINQPGALQFHQRIMRTIRRRSIHDSPPHKTAGPIPMARGRVVAKFLIGHRPVPTQGATRPPIIRHARLRRHPGPRQDHHWALAQLLDDVPQSPPRLRMRRRFLYHPGNRAQRGLVSKGDGGIHAPDASFRAGALHKATPNPAPRGAST